MVEKAVLSALNGLGTLVKNNLMIYRQHNAIKPKDSIKKNLLGLINSAKLQDTNSTHKYQLYFYILRINNPKSKLRRQFHLQ